MTEQDAEKFKALCAARTENTLLRNENLALQRERDAAKRESDFANGRLLELIKENADLSILAEINQNKKSK